jgi:hypothetical protein
MAQYNDFQYNGEEYNLTAYVQSCTETVTASDDLTKSVSITRTDSQASADALSGNGNLAAFLETVSILQRAKTPFYYNGGGYNWYMYNARLDEDEVLLFVNKVLSDAMSLSDFLAPFVIEAVLSETISDADTLSFSTDTSFYDFVFLSEYFRIEITNKALNDTLRVADWLSIERNPANSEWYD